MRVLVTTLLVICGLLSLSIHAQPPTANPIPKSETRFTGNVSVGETIVISSSNIGISIQIPAKGELSELAATEEERRQYEKVRQFLNQVRQGEADENDLSDELKELREKHQSLDKYMASMQSRLRNVARTVTRVGDDFIAYRRDNREVILPLHRISMITRPLEE